MNDRGTQERQGLRKLTGEKEKKKTDFFHLEKNPLLTPG